MLPSDITYSYKNYTAAFKNSSSQLSGGKRASTYGEAPQNATNLVMNVAERQRLNHWSDSYQSLNNEQNEVSQAYKNIIDSLTRMKVKATSLFTMNDTERNRESPNLAMEAKEFFSLLNARYSNGTYIFAGNKLNQEPVNLSTYALPNAGGRSTSYMAGSLQPLERLVDTRDSIELAATADFFERGVLGMSLLQGGHFDRLPEAFDAIDTCLEDTISGPYKKLLQHQKFVSEREDALGINLGETEDEIMLEEQINVTETAVKQETEVIQLQTNLFTQKKIFELARYALENARGI